MSGAWGDSFGYCSVVGTVLSDEYEILLEDQDFVLYIEDTEFTVEISFPALA
jgi:hypothetical protein